MILIVDMNSMVNTLGRDEFVRPLIRVLEKHEECNVRHYTEVGDVSRYSRIVVSGTPLKDNEYLDHLECFDWMDSCSKPVLGICAGMQALCLKYGSKLVESPEIGFIDVETTVENPLFTGTFQAYALHGNSVDSSTRFNVLARSREGLQAVKHVDKPFYGILFHPEARNTLILDKFTEID